MADDAVLEQMWSTASGGAKWGQRLLQTPGAVRCDSAHVGDGWVRLSIAVVVILSVWSPVVRSGSGDLMPVAAAGRSERRFVAEVAAAPTGLEPGHPAGLEPGHPTRHYTNPKLQVEGLSLAVDVPHRTIRGDGCRR